LLYAWYGRRFLRARLAVRVVLAAGVLAGTGWALLGGLEVPRMIAAQYSRIARAVIDLAAVVPPRPLFGLAAADAPAETSGAAAPVLLAPPPYPATRAAAALAGRRPPIFLVVIDAARADHIGLYGYGRDTAPALGRLARDAVVFDHAYANATATTTALRHLFTGRYASRYMLAKDHAPFFTGALVGLGYDRVFVNILGTDYNGVSRAAFIRNQPAAIAAAVEAATVELHAYDEPDKVAEASAALDARLAARASSPHPADGLFMFLHCIAPHWPWRNHDDHPIYGELPSDLYDNSIGHSDRALGAFLDHLRATGVYDDAIIVVTADHGTGLDEHGRLGGFQPYEEQLRVPLVVKVPGVAPRRVSAPVAAIDLAPTLLSLLAPGAPNPYEGESLAALLESGAPAPTRRWLFALNAFEDNLALLDLATGLKLHVHRAEGYAMLYDLRADPRETRNLADARPDLAAPLLALARRWSWEGRASWGNPYNYRLLEVE
jgi:arylsulfatase A-like enzyme